MTVTVAQTCQKQKGRSKYIIIVLLWLKLKNNISLRNWEYVVLSWIRTLNGLFLFQPIKMDNSHLHQWKNWHNSWNKKSAPRPRCCKRGMLQWLIHPHDKQKHFDTGTLVTHQNINDIFQFQDSAFVVWEMWTQHPFPGLDSKWIVLISTNQFGTVIKANGQIDTILKQAECIETMLLQNWHLITILASSPWQTTL